MGSSLKGVSEAFWREIQPDEAPLGEWIAEQRAAGLSWRQVAFEVRERTGSVIDVPPQTLLNWFGDREAVA